MTPTQERSITLSLNILYVRFFECTRQDFQYFLTNDEWALLMTAAGENRTGVPPAQLAVAVLQQAVARQGFFAGMTDFIPPAHYCSFLRDKIRRGERDASLEPCQPGQTSCPYATFEQIKQSR